MKADHMIFWLQGQEDICFQTHATKEHVTDMMRGGILRYVDQ